MCVKAAALSAAVFGVLLVGCASGNTDPADLGTVGDSHPLDQRVDRDPGPDGEPQEAGPQPDGEVPPDSAPSDSAPPDSAPLTEVCDNGKDDDGDGMIDCVDATDCGAKAPCVTASGTLVLQEVYPGTPDYLVIRNASTSPRNVSGFKIEMHGTGPVSFTLPSLVLGPGQSVHVFEYSDGQSGDIQTGDNIPFYNGLVGYENAVVLSSPAGTVIDYVGFGPTLIGLPSGASQSGGAIGYTGYAVSTESHHRAGMKGAWPTFQASDWVVYTKSR